MDCVYLNLPKRERKVNRKKGRKTRMFGLKISDTKIKTQTGVRLYRIISKVYGFDDCNNSKL